MVTAAKGPLERPRSRDLCHSSLWIHDAEYRLGRKLYLKFSPMLGCIFSNEINVLTDKGRQTQTDSVSILLVGVRARARVSVSRCVRACVHAC